jgi:hypothetical protein
LLSFNIFKSAKVLGKRKTEKSGKRGEINWFPAYSMTDKEEEKEMKKTVTETIPKDLFPDSNKLFFTAIREASFVKNVLTGEWVLVYYGSFLNFRFLVCRIKEMDLFPRENDGNHNEETFFACEYSGNIDPRFHHPTLMTYAGRLHPFLAPVTTNPFQVYGMTLPSPQNDKCPTTSRNSMVLSYVANSLSTIDLLFGEDKKGAPYPSRDVYTPKFILLEEKKLK